MSNRDRRASDDLKMIITGTDVAAVERLDSTAKAIGEELSRSLTTSQIRNIFGEVKTIELAVKSDAGSVLSSTNHRRLMMLRPKLAYQVGRESNRVRQDSIRTLATVLSDAISLVGDNRTYFDNFINFFEAILAYHRYHGGKNS